MVIARSLNVGKTSHCLMKRMTIIYFFSQAYIKKKFVIFSCGVATDQWCESYAPDYKLPYPDCCLKKCQKIRKDAPALDTGVAK
jgi:hypothetical protein